MDPNELIKAQNAGISLGSSARFNGATHNEIIQVYKSGVDLNDYASARRAGATHDEVMQVHKSGVNLYNYGHARREGATHDEAIKNSLALGE